MFQFQLQRGFIMGNGNSSLLTQYQYPQLTLNKIEVFHCRFFSILEIIHK